MKYKVDFISHQGNIRAKNEDNAYINGKYRKEVEELIVPNLFDHWISKNIMDYIYEVNFRISTHTINRKMATTYAALSIENNIYCFSNIGDSKGYLCRNGKIRKMTKDHNTVQLLVEEGLLTEEQAKKHPQRHAIYQALGMQEEDIEPEPYISEKQNAQEGDLLLLCTDGITDMITEAEIEEILLDKMIQNKVEVIVDKAMENGGKDNITALIVEVL